MGSIHVVNLTNLITWVRCNCQVNCFTLGKESLITLKSNRSILHSGKCHAVLALNNIEVSSSSAGVLAFTCNGNGGFTGLGVIAVSYSIVGLGIEGFLAVLQNNIGSDSFASKGLVFDRLNHSIRKRSASLELGINLCSIRRCRHREGVSICLINAVDRISLYINKASHARALSLDAGKLSRTTAYCLLNGDIALLDVITGTGSYGDCHCLTRNGICLVNGNCAIIDSRFHGHGCFNTNAHAVLVATGIKHNLVMTGNFNNQILVGISRIQTN